MDGLAGRISQAAVSPCRCADSRPGATPDRPQQLLRHQHPEQGAAVAIWLATLPDDGPTGQQFDADGPVPW
jgi:hypothetical protein